MNLSRIMRNLYFEKKHRLKMMVNPMEDGKLKGQAAQNAFTMI